MFGFFLKKEGKQESYNLAAEFLEILQASPRAGKTPAEAGAPTPRTGGRLGDVADLLTRVQAEVQVPPARSTAFFGRIP